MPVNPFPTLKDWQQKKKDYGIPGKVIKSGAFGEKMDKLRMAYNSAGGTAVDANNLDTVLQVLKQGDALVDEWLTKAKTMKASEFTKNNGKNDAIQLVEGYKAKLVAVKSRARLTVDPLRDARKSGLKRAIALYQDAVVHPSDAATLMELWDEGMRQHVGQGFNVAAKNAVALGYSAAVVNDLNTYNTLVAKWMKKMLSGTEAQKVARDPNARQGFLDDMHQALGTATRVLKQTAPH
jgi:hypothetical protein